MRQDQELNNSQTARLRSLKATNNKAWGEGASRNPRDIATICPDAEGVEQSWPQFVDFGVGEYYRSLLLAGLRYKNQPYFGALLFTNAGGAFSME